MKPEDYLVDALFKTLAIDPALRAAAWATLLPEHSSNVGTFANHPPLGEAKPDFLLRSEKRQLIGYVEAKVSSKVEPLQLFRGRSWARREAGRREVAVIFLVARQEELPASIGVGDAARWFRWVMWRDLLDALSTAARCLKAHKSGAVQAVAELVKLAASLCASPPDHQPVILRGQESEHGFPYGAVFEELRRLAPEYACDFVWGARVPPRLFVGHPLWARVFGKGEWQRLVIGYGLTRHADIKHERFAFNLLLWHRGDLADTDEIAPTLRLAWLKAAANMPGEMTAQFGGRQHGDRTKITDGVIPRHAATSYVALCTHTKSELPFDRYRTWSATRTAQALLKRLQAVDEFVRSLPNA